MAGCQGEVRERRVRGKWEKSERGKTEKEKKNKQTKQDNDEGKCGSNLESTNKRFLLGRNYSMPLKWESEPWKRRVGFYGSRWKLSGEWWIKLTSWEVNAVWLFLPRCSSVGEGGTESGIWSWRCRDWRCWSRRRFWTMTPLLWCVMIASWRRVTRGLQTSNLSTQRLCC